MPSELKNVSDHPRESLIFRNLAPNSKLANVDHFSVKVDVGKETKLFVQMLYGWNMEIETWTNKYPSLAPR